MVKEGYKETEIGVIPDDWNLLSAKNLMKIETGSRNTEHKSDNGKYLFFVRSQQVEHIDSYHYDCEAVLTAGDGVGTGKVFHYINGKFDAHQRVYVMSQFKEISGKFFYNYFKENFGNEVAKYTAKSSVDSVRRDMIAEMLIPVPSPEEQQKIAKALSDMDNLIAALEKLIEKKNAIKQACLKKMFPTNGEMQPHMRLPGFTDSWKPQKLGTITAYKNGKSYENQQIENGKYELVTLNSISIDGGLKASGKFVNNAYDTLLKNDLVMVLSDVGHGDLLGRVALIPQNNKFVLNQRVALLRIVDQTDPLFLFFYINANQNYFKTKGAGSSQLNISKECVEQFVVNLPSLKEQIKISEFFCDLDNVIENSQQKLEKCKKIKQGMMQQLLTGKIRLVSNDDGVTDKPEVDTLKSSSKGHNHQFDDAAVIAGIVDKFYSDKYPLGRKKVQKLLYLFRRHQEADTSAFKKKAAGPYADEIRYKGGEPIAIGNKYISVKKGSKGSSFSKGEKIADALTYLENWNLNDDIKWLCEQFKYIKTDRLELLATIDMAICDLNDSGETVTVDSIKNLIKSHPEWKAKLSKSYFKDNDIAWAIKECNKLFN